MNAFSNSQFNYCPTIWVFHSFSLNNKIYRLHERCLRMIYNDKQLNFEALLVKDNSVSVHHLIMSHIIYNVLQFKSTWLLMACLQI